MNNIYLDTWKQLIIGAVWLTAALYATPKYFYGFLITTTLPNGKNENLCILDRKRHDNKITDLVHFCLLYVLPLMVMMVRRLNRISTSNKYIIINSTVPLNVLHWPRKKGIRNSRLFNVFNMELP